MAPSINIEMRTAVEVVDVTGAACCVCGDVPYLAAFALVVYVNKRRGEALYLCQSCKEELDRKWNP